MKKFINILENVVHNDRLFDSFFHHYITAALFTSTDDEDQPLDHNYTATNFDKDSYEKLKKEAKRFFDETYDMISHNLKQAGHDFWLTKNHHGAGFWDGDWPAEIGKKLTDISHKYGETDIYVGDDGKLYI